MSMREGPEADVAEVVVLEARPRDRLFCNAPAASPFPRLAVSRQQWSVVGDAYWAARC
jgi:hypothetical protein